MSLFLIAAAALIALQFTSGIGQWISEHQQATQTVAKLQWLVSRIGLAPTIITTRVLVIAAFVVLYFLQLHFITWLMLAVAAWYLYKTGKYIVIWHQITAGAQTVIDNTTQNVLSNVVQDVTKTITVDASAASAAAKGVDVSKLS